MPPALTAAGASMNGRITSAAPQPARASGTT